MFKVIGKFSEDDKGMERENFEDIKKELGLIGSLTDDVGKLDVFYDNNGNSYVVAIGSENYYGIDGKLK